MASKCLKLKRDEYDQHLQNNRYNFLHQ